MAEKKPTFNERVDAKMREWDDVLSSLTGAKLLLVRDMVGDLCYIDAQLDEIKEDVRETGYNITNKQGNVVRNPDVMTQHQLVNEKNALIPKILKQIEGDSNAGSDDLLEFVRG